MKKGFTLVELLVCIAIIATLSMIGFHVAGSAKLRANQVSSSTNLRSLIVANMGYVSDHGTYCPAQEKTNRVRWHGGRSGSGARFDPAEGFLSPYFGKSDRVGVCPQFRDHVKGGDSFENGSGGYGYNAVYIGGTPADPFVPEKPANVRHPARTLMFATTAFAKADGLQEYPFAEPRTAVNPDGTPAYTLQPSVHFRFRGKALIAWCDGHISSERMEDSSSENYYGGSNEESGIGFAGPRSGNGWWNSQQ